MQKRKPPIRHLVHKHFRQNHPVHSYMRGHGYRLKREVMASRKGRWLQPRLYKFEFRYHGDKREKINAIANNPQEALKEAMAHRYFQHDIPTKVKMSNQWQAAAAASAMEIAQTIIPMVFEGMKEMHRVRLEKQRQEEIAKIPELEAEFWRQAEESIRQRKREEEMGRPERKFMEPLRITVTTEEVQKEMRARGFTDFLEAKKRALRMGEPRREVDIEKLTEMAKKATPRVVEAVKVPVMEAVRERYPPPPKPPTKARKTTEKEEESE